MKVDINNRTICIGNNIASFEDILIYTYWIEKKVIAESRAFCNLSI